MKLKVLKSDLFFISKRLKKINSNYFVCFNKVLKNFEVHFKKQRGGTFCFCVGKKLNFMAIKKTFLTQVKNAKKLFKEIEQNNKKIELENERRLTEKHLSEFSLMLDYASRRAGDVDFEGFQNFKWI